jgi:HNH endonuclease
MRQAVLMEAGYKCANPTCRHILTLELHHIVWVKDGGGNDPSNLVALCPNCHSLHTTGHIPKDAVDTWKSLLVSLNNPHRASADLLLVLYNEGQGLAQVTDQSSQPPPFRFTGDGLGVLAGILTSGLVEISRRFSGASFTGGGMPSFEVRLTDAGRRLVEAWRSGRPEAVRAVLMQNDGTA